jgi:hypothetical protein
MERGEAARLTFYLGLPLTVGFLLGTNQAGVGARMPWAFSVIFWTSCTLGAWFVFHLGTVIANRILHPWKAPLTAKLALGLLIASWPARFLINRYVGLYEGVLFNEDGVQSLPEIELSVSFAWAYLKRWLGVYALWVSANLFFDRIIGLPRYRAVAGEYQPALAGTPLPVRVADHAAAPSAKHEIAQDPTITPMVSELFSKVPRKLGYDLLMLGSEDHYLRVHTTKGDALVLYRLTDAIEELEELGYHGLRIHRSYWVRLDAVEGGTTDGRRTTLRLRGGLSVPVSRTYREMVRNAGLLDQAE